MFRILRFTVGLSRRGDLLPVLVTPRYKRNVLALEFLVGFSVWGLGFGGFRDWAFMDSGLGFGVWGLPLPGSA